MAMSTVEKSIKADWHSEPVAARGRSTQVIACPQLRDSKMLEINPSFTDREPRVQQVLWSQTRFLKVLFYRQVFAKTNVLLG